MPPHPELRGYRFCRIDDGVNEAEGLLPPILTKRVRAAVRARAEGYTAYLEGGEPVFSPVRGQI